MGGNPREIMVKQKIQTANQRRSERYPGRTYASLSTGGLAGCDQAFCIVVDVSRHGICVRTPQPPKKGQLATLRIGLEEEVHTVSARVVRVLELDTGHDVGLELHPDNPSHLRFYQAFEKLYRKTLS